MRLFEDVAEMVAWIARLRGKTTAQVVDPLIRNHVRMMYEEIEPEVEAIKKAEAELERVQREATERVSQPKPRKGGGK